MLALRSECRDEVAEETEAHPSFSMQYLRSYQDYVLTARNWTNAFATGDKGLKEKVSIHPCICPAVLVL